jgi:hypothetical protein
LPEIGGPQSKRASEQEQGEFFHGRGSVYNIFSLRQLRIGRILTEIAIIKQTWANVILDIESLQSGQLGFQDLKQRNHERRARPKHA